jgi:hypothetical protein
VPNGSQFQVNVPSGTVIVSSPVSISLLVGVGVGGVTAGSVDVQSSSLNVSTGLGAINSLEVTNGSVTAPYIFTDNLTLQTAVISAPAVSVSNTNGSTGSASAVISGTSLANLGLAGSLSLTDSTLTDAGLAVVSVTPSSISNSTVNGIVEVDKGATLTVDNTSTLNITAGHDLVVGGGGTGAITLQGGSQLNLSGSDLIVGVGPNSSGSFNLNGQKTSMDSVNETIGYQGTGTFTQSGGNNTISGQLVLGNLTGATGTYNLCTADSSCAATFAGTTVVIGNSGSGAFNQGGGTVSISGSLNLGVQASGSGSYTLDAGALTALQEFIGVNGGGTGTFTQDGGENRATSEAGSVFVANGGTYKLNDGMVIAVIESIGYESTGSFIQTGGVNETLSGAKEVGIGIASGSGNYSLQGGQLGTTASSSQFTEYVGINGGSGTLSQSGGTNYAYNIEVGENSGSQGTYSISGKPSTLGANFLTVGSSGGTGIFDQFGGTVGIQTLTVGVQASGTYALSGGSLESPTEIVGESGVGVFNQVGGTNNAGNLWIGSVPADLGIGGSNGAYHLSGGTLNADNEELGDGDLGTGTFSQTGGSNTTDSLRVNAGGTYNFSGGTLTYATIFLDPEGHFNALGDPVLTGGTLTNNGIVSASGGALTVVGSFINDGAYLSSGEHNTFANLTVGPAGYLQAAAGDVFTMNGNFTDSSTENKLWQTASAELQFTGGGIHLLSLAGSNGAGFVDDFGWGTLEIAPGNTVDLAKGSGNALYVNFLLGLDVSGNTITNVDGAAGLFVYYNAADNPTLTGDYNLTGGGELIPLSGGHGGAPSSAPEPSTWLLMAGGLGGLMARRSLRKRERNT